MEGTVPDSNDHGKKLRPDTWVTIAVIVAGFVVNSAVRSWELTSLVKRMDKCEASIDLKLDRSEFAEHNTTRTHYMVGSPAMDKLDAIQADVTEMKTILHEMRGR